MPVQGGGGERVCIHGCDNEGQGDPGALSRGAQVPACLDCRPAARLGSELREPSRDL